MKKILAAILFCCFCLGVIGFSACKSSGQQEEPVSSSKEESNISDSSSGEHEYGEWIAEVPATETKEGVKGHYHCSRCGKNFDKDYNILESLVIPRVETMTFGNYHGATEWIVLDKKADKTLIIAKDIIDSKPYHQSGGVTWENCTLRSWLNNEYINTAFTAEERNRILTTHVVNNDNPSYGTEGGNDTDDKVFLLSIEEAQSYFADKAARMAKGTDYAKGNGLYVYHSEGSVYDGNSFWWLRSPGGISDDAAFVILDGRIGYYGNDVGFGSPGVRPALWIRNQ